MTLLVAGSPVEIEVAADDAQLSPNGRQAALTLFHDLTSRLELDLLDSDAHGGEPWPRHRFWFGESAEAEAMLARLRALPDAAEAPGKAAVVFVAGGHGIWKGVLAAGSAPGWADALG